MLTHQRADWQIVGKCCGGLEEQRQVVLDAGGRDPAGDVLVQRRLRRITFEYFAEATPEPRSTAVIERKLASRKQAHFGHRIDGALAVDVERANRLDLVVEEVDAIRQRAAHRKQIDQSAANAVFAGRDHLRHVGVAGERQLRAQPIDIEPFVLRQEKCERTDVCGRRESIERRRRSDQHYVAVTSRDAIERRQTLGHQVLVRRKMIVGQRLPVGQDGNAQRRRKPRDFLGKALRRERVGTNHRDELFALRGVDSDLRQSQRIARAGERRRGTPLSGPRSRL